MAGESRDQDSHVNIYSLVVGVCVAIWPLWAKVWSVKHQDWIWLLRPILVLKVYQDNKLLARGKLYHAYMHKNSKQHI